VSCGLQPDEREKELNPMRWQLPVLMVLLCVVAVSALAMDEIEVPVLAGELPVASLTGSTGLVRTPSAEVVPPLKLNGGWHRVQFEADDQDLWSLNVALMKDLEVGGAHIMNTRPKAMAEDGALTDETVFNAKYRLDLGNWLELSADAPDVAVGVWDAADKLNRAVYVVATKEFSFADDGGTLSKLRLNLGYGRTEDGTSGTGEMFAGRALDGIFGGLEFVPFTNGLVQAEYDGIDYNAMLRVFPMPWLSLEGGTVNGEFAWGATFRSAF
jgi:hypothetical protein